MQLVQQKICPLVPLQGHDELEQLINQSLRHDWVIQVEHLGQSQSAHTEWLQWGKALFAISGPEAVLDTIYACRAYHPTHSIRMRAEKVRPQASFIYTVYDALSSKIVELQGPIAVTLNSSHSKIKVI